MCKDVLFFSVQSILKYNSFEWGQYLRSKLYPLFFKKSGKHLRIRDGVTIKYPSGIELGENCYIGEGCYLVGKEGLFIGDNFLMGAGSKIITSNHNFQNVDIPIVNQELSFDKVTIGNNVWLGFDVKIFGGSHILDNSIVGAGSIVKTKFMEDSIIIAGIPAVIIRKR